MKDNSNQSAKEVVTPDQLMEIVKKVISRHVAKGSIPKREASDAEMSVFEKFWDNRRKIFNSFEGRSQITTYCIAVANRMCCEFIRKEKKHWNQMHENMETVAELRHNTSRYEAEKNILVNQEVKRFSNALHFFNGERSKLKLFLKYYFDVPVKHSDAEDYFQNNPEAVLSLLNQSGKYSKKEKFEMLAELVNRVEEKNIKSDSVRMWLNDRIDTLLRRLNGEGISMHNNESLAILLEMTGEASFSHENR